jgi:hypothetical protein
MKSMIDYCLSVATFPVNKELKQHRTKVSEKDTLFECTLLAGKILGVPCNDTEISSSEGGATFQITPAPEDASTEKEFREYQAFLDYFHENYGMRKDRCYFPTHYEAFFNLIKAWKIWKEILSDDEKKRYFKSL